MNEDSQLILLQILLGSPAWNIYSGGPRKLMFEETTRISLYPTSTIQCTIRFGVIKVAGSSNSNKINM